MADRLREEILAKEITRKQFLQYMSGIFIGLFGVSSFISSLLNYGNGSKVTNNTDSGDGRFGTRKFGR